MGKDIIILGLGFTGARLARRLLGNNARVFAPVRGVERFADLARNGLELSELDFGRPPEPSLPRNAKIALLIPPLPEPGNTALRSFIHELAPTRVVYVSSTGVYGDRTHVNCETPADPGDERGRLRLAEERCIASGPWTSLILRAAAIYGPGRGVHVAVREGKLPRGAGAGVVSRIHVDDLAAIIEAGIFSDIGGAWPVADNVPCSSAEIARWCAKLLGLPDENKSPNRAREPEIDRVMAGRSVDGGKIREMLGVELIYEGWEAGIAASLAEENA